MILDEIREECIECGACTRNCLFLEKYEMDLKRYTYREDLAYSCFLCGRCKAVCPKDLDGRRLSLHHREKKPENFPFLRFMKNKYKMRNNTKNKSEDLLFLGCNFPGFFPETSKKLSDLYLEKGIDFSVDCCGKPLSESADRTSAENVKEHLTELFQKKGTRRIHCACPNCYHYFKSLKDFPFEILTVFESMREFGFGKPLEKPVELYLPCPDREGEEILTELKYFLKDYELPYKKVNCCGAGGLANRKEPDVAEGFIDRLKEKKKRPLYTYCATCCGQFENAGVFETKHLISEILGIHEKPNTSFVKNVINLKFYKRSRK